MQLFVQTMYFGQRLIRVESGWLLAYHLTASIQCRTVVSNRQRPTMSKTLELPYYTIKSEELANWLDDQPESWWIVDGDPVLTSHVDFPCPSEELSAELRSTKVAPDV